MRWALLTIGVIMVLLGALSLLQGVGIVPGSFMTGDSFWATTGLLVAIVGAVLCFFGLRHQSQRPRS